MADWEISDTEIEDAERSLLPDDCHFDEEAREVIRRWKSAEVVACPGSGKTTVLLAKLKILADRMPLEGGAGICVLSHTNAAVGEIEARMPSYADRLLGHPNYIGTIQSFVDRYLVAPCFRWKYGVAPHPVDDEVYARIFLSDMRNTNCRALANLIEKRAVNTDEVNVFLGIRVRDDGALTNGSGTVLSGADTPSAKQYAKLKTTLLTRDGTIRYNEAFEYAARGIRELPIDLPGILRRRFAYVFVDEYQDCDLAQREIIRETFDTAGCCLMCIGDPDQAIYSPHKEDVTGWHPGPGAYALGGSNRYGQSIANVLSSLRSDGMHICSNEKCIISEPALIVYDQSTIKDVPHEFAALIERRGLSNSKGIFKAIGYIKKESTKGTKIGSYWKGFESQASNKEHYGYWSMVEDIRLALLEGKLFKAEPILRKLLRSIFRYANVREQTTGAVPTWASVRNRLGDSYGERLLALARSSEIDSVAIDRTVRVLLADIFEPAKATNVLNRLPAHFMRPVDSSPVPAELKNVYIDPCNDVKIQFDTIHGVKGQTHDATLYLETEKSRGTDIRRALEFCGFGRKKGKSDLHDYSRKLFYVGMSRPRKLLCAAVCLRTYEECREFFHGWELIDLRHKDSQNDR